MHVKIKNWRCIKEIEFDLSRINIFLGQNATGKSSLAYALYFFSKSQRLDVKKTLSMLYDSAKRVVRIENGRSCYPSEISIDNSFFVRIIEEDWFGPKIERSEKSPWEEEYLLPSTRVAYIQILSTLQKHISEQISDLTELAKKFKYEIERIPLPNTAKTFLSDLDTAINKSQLTIVDNTGYAIEIKLLMPYLMFKVSDKFIDLKLSPENAPDGQTDQALIDFILSRASEGSLIVIEEPEIYKNPLFQFEMMDKISKLALDKNLTIIMTTHSEIIPLAIAKLVEEGKLKPDDVRIYYLTRSKEEPWTKIKKIEVYENGTLEELPDTEKVMALLF